MSRRTRWLLELYPAASVCGAGAENGPSARAHVDPGRDPLSLLAGLLENEVFARQSAGRPQLADGGRLTADGDGHAFLA